jgi:hypothetical protein
VVNQFPIPGSLPMAASRFPILGRELPLKKRRHN